MQYIIASFPFNFQFKNFNVYLHHATRAIIKQQAQIYLLNSTKSPIQRKRLCKNKSKR